MRLSAISLSILFSALTGCGDTPSSIGQIVQDRLSQKKESFESEETKNKFEAFINSQDNWSEEIKNGASSTFNFVRSASEIVDPELVKNGVESSEMAIACTMTLMKDKKQVETFTKNLLASVDNNKARMEVIEQIASAKVKVATAAVKKENCL